MSIEISAIGTIACRTGRRQSLAGVAAAACLILVLLLSVAAGAGESPPPDAAPVPRRVVSLVPAATEMLLAIGAGDALVGVTHHDATLPGATGKTIVGGFRNPSVAKIKALAPDLIVVSSLHRKIKEAYQGSGVALLEFKADSVPSVYANLRLLGRLFGRQQAAEETVAAIEAQLDTIAVKVAAIPAAERLRTVRVMGALPMTVPGDDSFQNDYIRAAGGIPPQWGRPGQAVRVSLKEWQRFDPQVIYACGNRRDELRAALNRPGWREVEAVRRDRIFFFPCNLTCRASVHAGDFVSWLAARLYDDRFLDPRQQLRPDQRLAAEPVALDLAFVAKAQVVASLMHDFVNKTLVIDFTAPQTVLSTLEGWQQGIETVANHALPPPSWRLAGDLIMMRRDLAAVLGREQEHSSFLFTGADMDNLSVQRASFREMTVYALVTAGVESNALRTSRDSGAYYEPGTINVILLANMALSPRAMTRALITATEAKTAALADLDVRSSYTPATFQATGTGTDNIIVVGGEGRRIDNAGGHTKMGELIARVVYDGVREAIRGQNGLTAGRPVLRRLAERHVDLYRVLAAASRRCRQAGEEAGGGAVPSCATVQSCDTGADSLTGDVEELLLTPRYAGFVEAAMEADDSLAAGTLADAAAFSLWGGAVADEIAGRPLGTLRQCVVTDEELPLPLATALNALVNGVVAREAAANNSGGR